MGIIYTGKERFENLLRKTKWKKSKQKKRPSRKPGKNKLSLQLTIPSRRGKRKKMTTVNEIDGKKQFKD